MQPAYGRAKLSNNATLRPFLSLPRTATPATFEAPLYNLFHELDDLFLRPLPFGRANFVDRSVLENLLPRVLGSHEKSGVRLATPRYEITEDDSEFKLAVDVPGVKAGDMKIKLEQDGRVLRLTGERKIQDGNLTSEIRFDKAFLLDKKIQADQISANLSDGVVVITAPKELTKQKNEIEIPITEINRAAVTAGEEAETEVFVSTGKG
jgi:HSP20 family protein